MYVFNKLEYKIRYMFYLVKVLLVKIFSIFDELNKYSMEFLLE